MDFETLLKLPVSGPTPRTQFNKAPSQLYIQALNAMRVLVGFEGPSVARDVLSDATAELLEKEWAKQTGLKRSSLSCICRLIGQRCLPSNCDNPPGCDHSSLWTKDGKPVCFVFQPYGLEGNNLTALVAYANQRGLRLSINTWPAWHYPGSVLHVELWRDEDSI